jgi:hypothetical protein
MRRRLEVFIPIVLLAILVQLFAPIAGFRLVAYAATDPSHLAPICAGMASSPDAQTAPAKSQHDQADCCVICAARFGGSIAVGTPSLIFVILQRLYFQVPWVDAGHSMPAARVGSNTQARAPPLLT